MNPKLDIQVDAVLFDMDGTLIDSTAQVDLMWTDFAHEQGLDPQQVLAFAHGVPSIATLRHFVSDPAGIQRWFERISRNEQEHFDDVVEIGGAEQLLRALPGDAWAVVTSALRAPAIARFAVIGMPRPPVLVGADDVSEGKPSPEGYLAAAKSLGVDPSRCVVFEDTAAGIAAARAAGATPVVVGDRQHESMAGLPRVANWHGVRVEHGSKARLRLTTA